MQITFSKNNSFVPQRHKGRRERTENYLYALTGHGGIDPVEPQGNDGDGVGKAAPHAAGVHALRSKVALMK